MAETDREDACDFEPVAGQEMIVKTNAIVLRVNPYSETSRIVTWLSHDCGKITTIIKGAQRRKSAFLGQFDLFYTCELLFYLKSHDGLHVVKECAPLNTRFAFRRNWKSAVCASYLSDLVARIAPVHAAQPELYRWMDSALNILSRNIPACACIFWLELSLMDIMGLAPQLGVCTKCRRGMEGHAGGSRYYPEAHAKDEAVRCFSGRHADEKSAAHFFSCIKGGLYCSDCAPDARDAVEIPPDVLGLLRFWQSAPELRSAQSSKCAEHQVAFAENLLGGMIRFHMGIPLDSRSIALDMLRARNAPAIP